MQQQPGLPDPPKPKQPVIRNPLLSLAQADSPFNFPESNLLMPVTPATPAVLQDDPVPAAELDSFIGQAQPPKAPSPFHSTSPPGLSQVPLGDPNPSQQPQKQSYFTSILSSLPNLSLSAITGDNTRQQQSQQQNIGPPPPSHGPPQNYGPYGAPPSTYQTGQSHQPGVGDLNLGFAAPPLGQLPPPVQQSPQPPPVALPPSGGAASYRLGNQRRLKYAPLPDLATSNQPSQQYQAPPLPAFPSQQATAIPPSIYNPNVQTHSPSGPQQVNPQISLNPGLSTPTLSGPPSSQGSLHNSFRSSPIATPLNYSLNSPSLTPSNYSASSPVSPPSGFLLSSPTSAQNTSESGFAIPPPPRSSAFGTSPQAIPSRLPEPATPQNTPADVAFSGFNAYRQQQQQETGPGIANAFGAFGPPKTVVVQQFSAQLEAVKEGVASSDRTFSPINAAQVTEKLENLIAEQNDDALSVKSELSAEVDRITSSIPSRSADLPASQPEPSKEDVAEELTEIDLNVRGISDTLAPIGQDTFETQQQQQQSLDSFTVPSATSFFSDTPDSNQNAPTFYNPSFQQQQPLTDPFSFAQSPATTSFSNNATSLSGPSFGIETQARNPLINSSPFEQPKTSAPADNVDLTQHFWGSPATQVQHSASSPYGAPPHVQSPAAQPEPIQPPPTFFNPSQFASTQSTFAQPPASLYTPAPVSSFGDFGNNFSSSPNKQLPTVTDGGFNAVPEPTGLATLNHVQMSVNPHTNRTPQETVPPSLQNLASGATEIIQMQYRPVYHHWFYRREVETKTLWIPFSMHDSLNLDEVHNSNEISPETKVATDGGRYDVEILRRQRSPVYWTGPQTEVRRCSWFYKGPAESRYTPYEESVAARLEEEFKQACTTNNWNRRVDLNNGEYIIFHSPTVQAHYLQATTPELAASWGNNSGSEDNAYLQGATSRPRVVKRGMDEFNIDDGEPERVDHLLFLVHGIGSVCDLKFRTVEEVVDEFRSISLQLVQSHYRSSTEQGIVHRIEVLPISWHATLHSGIDKKLQVITLESIPKLRHFTNDTLLDILFYTSPIYCQTIMQTVGNEMNRLYALFNQRNPEFNGNVYLGGHSLGSLIVFDLLCHQKPPAGQEEGEAEASEQTEENEETAKNEDGTVATKPLLVPAAKRKLSKRVSYMMGVAGTGQPYINYPQLAFNPRAFFALGSPIGMFVTVRGIDNLGDDFTLPTCPAFFNIFHPFDPVAYRVESLITPEAHKYRPMLIPHHKGRKRMHLELKETMARVGADLKQKLLESVRNTWNSVYQMAMFHKPDNQTLEQEIEKVVEEQMNSPRAESVHSNTNDDAYVDMKIGKLNGGRRIDYVLQEAPFEYINEYLFALTSHVCYWESEDTMLMILKEIYGSMGIQTDAQLPQQSMSIERVSTPSYSNNPSNVASPTSSVYGIDPTAAITNKPVGPPPTAGFVKKS